MFSKSESDELLQCFLTESVEHLEGIESLLLQLESASPEDREKLTNRVFRAAHSIKGSSGMFGLTTIHELAHKTEWILEFLRSGKIPPSTDLIDLLLRSFDSLRNLIDNVAQSNAMDVSAILKSLDETQTLIKCGEAAPVAEPEVMMAQVPASFALPEEEIVTARQDGHTVYLGRLELIGDLDRKNKSLLELLKLLQGLGSVLHLRIDFDAFDEAGPAGTPGLPTEILYATDIGHSDLVQILDVPPEMFQLLEGADAPSTDSSVPSDNAPPGKSQEGLPAAGNESQPPVPPPEGGNIQVQEKTEPTLRVKVSLLENLMNLAGELVLSRNQLREALSRNDMRAIRVSGQRMGQVTTELQETIMMTRLQPLDRVFSKFPRMIREISRQLRKEINLVMEGREVELDKTLIEGLGDPLTHMIRNAADHGVETPEERVALGKRNPATVKLLAFYEAGQVIIEVSDDGHGIEGDKVCRKAVERNLISADKARQLSPKEKQHLIFLPGLSTADQVSELSGRGVGMDVVKANIDRLGGKVEIVSELGKGSSFRIKLPLTLAIIPSLILSTSKEIFAIPQVNVLEMLLIPAEMVKRRIEVIGDQDVLILRGKLLPLISLNEFLGAPRTFSHPGAGEEQPDRRENLADRRSPRHRSPIEGLMTVRDDRLPLPRSDGRRYHASGDVNVVVVTTGNFSYGLVVDKPLFTEEIVVKQLGRDLKGLSEYSGATIMGDGRIALIIDVLGLAMRANILGQHQSMSGGIPATPPEARSDAETVPFLAFRYGGPEMLVLPLFLVIRLEKIQLANIVTCGGWKAIQYGERMLPVFLMSETSSIQPLQPDQECGVVVIRIRDREIGLVAALPIQVIEMKPDFDFTVLRQPGIAGSKVWNRKTVLFVDIWELLLKERPELLEFNSESASRLSHAPEIMVLEPVEFFQQHLRLQLENQGFTVVMARTWEEVEGFLSVPRPRFRALLADLTALRDNAFEGVRGLRDRKKLNGTPVAALHLNGGVSGEELAAVGIDFAFQKLENQHLPAWLEGLKSRSGDGGPAAPGDPWKNMAGVPALQ